MPTDGIALIIIKYRGQLELPTTDDFEIGKVSLPHLVWCRGLVVKLLRRFDGDVSWAVDQVLGLEQAINKSL